MCPFMYGEGDGFGMTWNFQKMPLDEFKMKRLYQMHNAHVLRAAPKDKLLILTDETRWNWETICEFINVKVPEDTGKFGKLK